MNENDINNPQTQPVENIDDKNTPLTPPAPKIINENLADIAERKRKEIAKKQRLFKQLMTVFRLVVLALILLIAGVNIWKWQQKHSASPFVVQNPTTAPPNTSVVIDDTNPVSWKIFNSDKIKVFIRHPQSVSIFEKETPALKAVVVYAPKNENLGEVDEANLKEGYIFKVTPLDVGLRSIDAITDIKIQSFKERCPDSATFSRPRAQLVDTIDARTFEITNCEVDYVVSYIPRFGIYYEIAQIFKGDFGIRQKYKTITGEMLKAFRFYPEDTRPVGEFKTFIDEYNRYLVAHPNLDTECCVAPEPPSTDRNLRFEKSVSLGDRNTFRDQENFDGMSIYIARSSGGYDFNTYVQKQREFLTEDYKVVMGVPPTTQDIEIQIGEFKGIMLRGYTWRKNDLIYFQTRNKTFVVSVKNLTGERFEKTVNDVLKSFETF